MDGGRILIVDDAKANVDLLVEALRGDYKLGVALDGEAALRSIERNPPDRAPQLRDRVTAARREPLRSRTEFARVA